MGNKSDGGNWSFTVLVLGILLILGGCEGWNQYQRTLRERARIDAGESRPERHWWEPYRD